MRREVRFGDGQVGPGELGEGRQSQKELEIGHQGLEIVTLGQRELGRVDKVKGV